MNTSITLTGGMRQNLYSMQQTQNLMEKTQGRLASGKRVQSALDDPINYFASLGHEQRANDLASRKDEMSEAIQTVKAGDSGIDAITTMNEVKAAEIKMKRSLRKPHPYSVLQTAKALGAEKRFLYVGDLPDDMLAAREAQAGITIGSVGFPWFTPNPKTALQEIQKTKPDFILKKAVDLPKLVRKGVV